MDRKQLSEVVKAYYSGLSVEEVAKVVGVSSDSKVWHLLKSAGVPLRKPNYSILREYNGVLYRGSYELAFAKLLDELGIAFQHEPRKFTIKGNSSYTPDFYLVDLDIYIELKGYDRGTQPARRALVVEREGISLIVLGKEELEAIGAI